MPAGRFYPAREPRRSLLYRVAERIMDKRFKEGILRRFLKMRQQNFLNLHTTTCETNFWRTAFWRASINLWNSKTAERRIVRRVGSVFAGTGEWRMSFLMRAFHPISIPDGYYVLLGSSDYHFWVVGRRHALSYFEKMSVLAMADEDVGRFVDHGLCRRGTIKLL